MDSAKLNASPINLSPTIYFAHNVEKNKSKFIIFWANQISMKGNGNWYKRSFSINYIGNDIVDVVLLTYVPVSCNNTQMTASIFSEELGNTAQDCITIQFHCVALNCTMVQEHFPGILSANVRTYGDSLAILTHQFY